MMLTPDKKYISNIDYKQAPSHGNTFKELRYLIMHYTAGRSFNSTLAHFMDPASKVSAHFLVGRGGEVKQLVSLDNPAWHAGPDSAWKEYERPNPSDPVQTKIYAGLNFYSIGIEFDNPGPITKVGKEFRTWYGEKVSPSDVAEVDPTLPTSFNQRYWFAFSKAQISYAQDLTTCLVRGFGLKDVLGHSDVCPGRKQDPGPLFPLKHIKAIALGREG